MSEPEKEFDAIAMMRAERDKLSAEIEGMTLDEELEWLASRVIADPFSSRLRDRAARETGEQRPSDGR